MSLIKQSSPSWESMHRRMKGAACAATAGSASPSMPYTPAAATDPAAGGAAQGDVRFACPFCAQHIACDAVARGQPLTCPKCDAEVCVPSVQGEAPGLTSPISGAPVGILLPAEPTAPLGPVLSYIPAGGTVARGEIKFACPKCAQHIACYADAAGRGLTCPACGTHLRVPAPPVANASRSSGPGSLFPEPPRRIGTANAARQLEPTPTAAFGSQPTLPCPKCGGVRVGKVRFTWWGAWLGPWIFHHVRCQDCATTFNRETGRSNDTGIALFVIVGIILGGLLGLAWATHH